ncbi:MAG TPA: hypothetical protein DCR39_01055 [Nitrospiraceae bacterium]|nr:hypothetical protein [Nitrospiraceae bacterium]
MDRYPVARDRTYNYVRVYFTFLEYPSYDLLEAAIADRSLVELLQINPAEALSRNNYLNRMTTYI